ncbi:hypothetical protein UFOVP299_24 [uncultured Caudovirales phage]|uniref:Uncharacterized protein n=1 Tax=uncultured Caudovirales phage TaxID=2100421 RepID=A0A6J5LNP1_9CAUD|nr:hypothetical protein UFOVP299_24 [uncultured Caudovirales phage]
MEFKIDIPTVQLKQALDSLDVDFSEIHKLSTLDLKSKVSKPQLAISIGYDDIAYNGEFNHLIFGTFGNISMIKGEEKARKSWLKSLLLGCCFQGNSVNYSTDIKGHNLQDKYVIDLDTEQDSYYSRLGADRICKMYGTPQSPVIPDNYIAINLREHNAKIRRDYLKWLFMESEYRNKLGVVSIDGYVDMLDNFNDLVESTEFTQSLMKYSTLSKAHITGVLHLNPGQDKARGHLGTILQQKCETVVIIKDEGSFSSVTCQRGRGKKWAAFGISVDKDWLPYTLTLDNQILESPKNKPNF